MLDFYVYILKCSDGSYYTGHTDDTDKRISEHKNGIVHCYTSDKLPVKLVFMENFPSRYEALCVERKIKKWTSKKKEALIKGGWPAMQGINKKLKINKETHSTACQGHSAYAVAKAMAHRQGRTE